MAERWEDPEMVQQVAIEQEGDELLDENWADQYPTAGPAAEQVMKQRYTSACTEHGLRKKFDEQPTKTVKRTVDIAATRNILRAKGKKALEPSEKGMYAAAVCDAVWTRARLQDADYEVDTDMCAKCGVERDTVHHRVWRCQHDQCVKERS